MFVHKHVSANSISLQDFPFKMELAMQAYLLENPEVLNLDSKDDNSIEIIQNEVQIENQRIDLIAKYGTDYLAIIELKKDEIKKQDLEQLEKYLEKRKQVFDKITSNDNENYEFSDYDKIKWYGILIGSSIEKDLMTQIVYEGYTYTIENKDDNIGIPIIAMTINRFKSEEGNVFIITDKFLPEKISNKDTTQYEFNGEIYGKGKLVLAVIKDYVKNHPDTTFDDLKCKFEVFTNTIVTLDEARKIANTKGRKRHFINPDQVITLNDESKVAVSDQWGVDRIGEFLSKADQLGIEINIVKK